VSEKPVFTEYILKNISHKDISFSDLIYNIPAGKSRNLLGKTARLKYEDIMKSRESGSIAKKIKQGLLVEITAIVTANPPPKTVAKPTVIQFPQRTKSSIVIEVNEVFEESQEVLNEEDEILKQLDQLHEENVVPIITKRDDEKEKKVKT
jgi:hypothetical protein